MTKKNDAARESVTKERQIAMRYWMSTIGMIAVLVTVLAMVVYLPKGGVQAVDSSGDWSTYIGNNARTGYNSAETAINATTAPNLKVHWTYPTGGIISTQPVEANGMVYWGSWNGNEYATSLAGNKIWSTFISTPTPNCTNTKTYGVASTATVATVPMNGTNTSVVFVGGKDSLYALDANTGAIIWKQLLSSTYGTFVWSSPAVYNGSVYIGYSSVQDCPGVQGALVQIDATTGAIQHTFYVVPTGCIGGGIWSSPAIDEATGTIYVATGNKSSCNTKEIYTSAFVELSASDLSVIDYWQVPKAEQINDSDFGATPTLFSASLGNTTVNMIGAVNKNGTFYALDRTSLKTGPLWRAKIGTGRINIAPSAWDGTTLYVASRGTIVGGTKCFGSLRALNPTTGTFIWEHCLSKPVYGAVSAVLGVVFVVEGFHLVAIATASGKTLFDYKTNGAIYGAASISNGIVYVGNTSGTLYAFGL